MRGERQVGIAVRADVIQLLQNHSACGFDGIGDLAKMRDHGVIGMGVIAPCQHARAVNGHGFGNNHPRPAQGAFHQIALHARAGNAHV